MSKHAKSNRRLQKAAVVSTAALVLPVLGAMATPAYADGTATDTTQTAQANNGQGADKRSEQSSAGGQGAENRNDNASAGSENRSEQATRNSGTRGHDPDTGNGGTSEERSAPKAGDNPSQESNGNRPTDVDTVNNANAGGKGANADGPFNATDGTIDEGGQQQGSRGKADDKNPPGQVNNTRDNGFECDDNSGIGDSPADAPGKGQGSGRSKGNGGGNSNDTRTGNPAHTGCDRTPAAPQDEQETKPGEEEDEVLNEQTPVNPEEDSGQESPEDVENDDMTTNTPETTTPGVTTENPPTVDQPEQNPPVGDQPAQNPPTGDQPEQNPPAANAPGLTPPGQEPTEVLAESLIAPTVVAQPALEVAAVLAERPSVRASVTPSAAAFGPAALPFTGTDTDIMALVALASLAVGGGLVVVARRIPA